MTTFFVFLGQITYLFLSLNQVTALLFEEDIERFIYGGRSEEIHLEVLADGKTLLLRPKVKNLTANLLVFTKTGRFNFHPKMRPKDHHEFVEIKLAVKNSRYQVLKRAQDFDLLDGTTSLLFKNKGPKPLKVNNQVIRNFEYLSKGAPLFINDMQIYP